MRNFQHCLTFTIILYGESFFSFFSFYSIQKKERKKERGWWGRAAIKSQAPAKCCATLMMVVHTSLNLGCCLYSS